MGLAARVVLDPGLQQVVRRPAQGLRRYFLRLLIALPNVQAALCPGLVQRFLYCFFAKSRVRHRVTVHLEPLPQSVHCLDADEHRSATTRHRFQRALGGACPDQGRVGLLIGLGPQHWESRFPKPALMVYILAGPGFYQQLFGFVNHLPALFHGDAETYVLVLVKD